MDDDGTAGDGTGGVLDALAADIADQQLEMLSLGRLGRGRVERLARREGVVGTVVGFAAGVVTVGLTIVAMVRMSRRGFAGKEVRTPYREVTGFDRDRADSDLRLVDHRLSALVGGLGMREEGTPDDAREVVGAAARRLVRWVAAGRPRDPGLEHVRRAYEALMDAMDERDDAAVTAAGDAYVDAWRATLGA